MPAGSDKPDSYEVEPTTDLQLGAASARFPASLVTTTNLPDACAQDIDPTAKRYDDTRNSLKDGPIDTRTTRALASDAYRSTGPETPSRNRSADGVWFGSVSDHVYDGPSTFTAASEFIATKPGTLLRGDGRAAAEIFEDGMTARNPAMSIEEHLAGGGTV